MTKICQGLGLVLHTLTYLLFFPIELPTGPQVFTVSSSLGHFP